MKMKLLVAAAAIVMAGSVMAQSAFEGFYGQVGAGYESNSVASSSFNYNGADVSTPSGSKDAAQINLGLGYNVAITKEFLLGIGVEYSAISSTFESGELNSVVGCGGGCGATQKYTASNRTSIFLTPGYAIAKDKLAYVKAGYSMQTLKSVINEI
jgi:opacity protein-like surface antigen